MWHKVKANATERLAQRRGEANLPGDPVRATKEQAGADGATGTWGRGRVTRWRRFKGALQRGKSSMGAEPILYVYMYPSKGTCTIPFLLFYCCGPRLRRTQQDRMVKARPGGPATNHRNSVQHPASLSWLTQRLTARPRIVSMFCIFKVGQFGPGDSIGGETRGSSSSSTVQYLVILREWGGWNLIRWHAP